MTQFTIVCLKHNTNIYLYIYRQAVDEGVSSLQMCNKQFIYMVSFYSHFILRVLQRAVPKPSPMASPWSSLSKDSRAAHRAVNTTPAAATPPITAAVLTCRQPIWVWVVTGNRMLHHHLCCLVYITILVKILDCCFFCFCFCFIHVRILFFHLLTSLHPRKTIYSWAANFSGKATSGGNFAFPRVMKSVRQERKSI